MKTVSRKFLVSILMALVLLSTTVASAAKPAPISIQILNVSDWHGQLDPVSITGVGNVGGAAAISTYWQADRLANPNTLTLTAGDAVGATPPLSTAFNDEPAILAMNLMGIQVDTFGNHNFDHGIARLQSQIELADFPYVSANLANRDANLSGVQDFQIFTVGGVKIGVIGITNPEAPGLVFPGSFGTIVPSDPVAAALRARNAAKDAGAEIIMVITHMGVTGFTNGAPFGPLIDFANAVNKPNNVKIDIIVGDHTDVQYSGTINGALVYENKSKGVTYAKASITVDGGNHRILSKSVQIVTPLSSAVTPDPAIVALLAPYRVALAPILNVQVGVSSVPVFRTDSCGNTAGRTCESLVGDLTTDALRSTYGAEFAITNSGGLRAALTCPTADLTGDFCPAFTPPPFPITRGQVNGVLPFGNVVVTLSVNGAELKAMLENGVSRMPAVDGRFPQVSGLCFTYDISAPVGSRVVSAVRQASDGSCTGAAVDLTAATTYAIAENDFMASGGDGYPNLASRMVSRDIMDQVLADYITASSPISPALQGRIVCTDSNGVGALDVPNCPVVTAP